MPKNDSKTILDQIVDAKLLEICEQKKHTPLNVL